MAPLRLLPLIVTLVPIGPLVGLKPLIVGGGGGIVTLKLALLVALPVGVVTVIGPVVAPAGTVALICVLPPTVKLAFVPLKVTFDAFWNHCPLIVTVVPTRPLVGLKPLMTGVFDGAETLAAGGPSNAPSATRTMSASLAPRLRDVFDSGDATVSSPVRGPLKVYAARLPLATSADRADRGWVSAFDSPVQNGDEELLRALLERGADTGLSRPPGGARSI